MSAAAHALLRTERFCGRPVNLEVTSNPAVGRSKGTLLLVNGYTCEKSYWAAQVPLVTQGYDVVRFNPRGIGDSQLGDTTRDSYFEHTAEDMLSICAQLDIRHPHIVAHSMGALPVVEFLREVSEPQYAHLQPSSLVLVTPVLDDIRDLLPTQGRIKRMVSAVARWRFNRIARARNSIQTEARLCHTLTLFQFASPLALLIMGAPPETRHYFSEFLTRAEHTDPHTQLLTLESILFGAHGTAGHLTDYDEGRIYFPPRVTLVTAEHDLLVEGAKAERICHDAFDDLDLRIQRSTDRSLAAQEIPSNFLRIERMQGVGHFPHQENPEAFNAILLRHLEV